MTDHKKKLLALLAKAEELEAKAIPVEELARQVANRLTVQYREVSQFDRAFIALRQARSFALPVLRLLVERLDECSRCCGSEMDWRKGDLDIHTTCPSCTPRYAALCAELEKLGVMEKE